MTPARNHSAPGITAPSPAALPRDPAAAIAASAEAMLGVPFQLYGRDPAHGLDCVGLVLRALEEAGLACAEPPPYRMRGGDLARLLPAALPPGLYELRPCMTAGSETTLLAGDIVLMRCAPAQYHLAIIASPSAGAGAPQRRYIHAHAALRRIVAAPGLPPFPLLRLWRARQARQSSPCPSPAPF